jgi:uncharacterized protein (TIGR02145 family)
LTTSIKGIQFSKDSLNYDLMTITTNDNSIKYILNLIRGISFYITDEPVPQITKLSPEFIKIGEELSIIGNNFGTNQSTSIVRLGKIDQTNCIFWSDTLIKIKVPARTVSSPVSVTVNNIKSNEILLNIVSYLISLSPTSGRYGTTVTIKGMSLGSVKSNNSIEFNGIVVSEYVSWNDTLIKVKVPVGCKSGSVSATINNNKTNQLNFTILHSLQNVTPSSGRVGDTLSISGVSLGKSKDSSYVSFNMIKVKDYIFWSDSLVKVKVPIGAKTCKISLTLNKIKSNELDFQLIPTISSLYPDSAGITQIIYVYGSGFGDVQANGKVLFNNVEAIDYQKWSDNEISVSVPIDAKSGFVQITIGDVKSNQIPFFTKVYLTNLTPNIVKTGEKVTLHGFQFGDTKGDSYVKLTGSIPTEYSTWSDTSVTFTIPEGTNSGPVSLIAKGIISNEVIIVIIPEIASINPTSERIGSEVTISGKGFNTSKGNSVVSFNNADVTAYTDWKNNSIKVNVPGGAKTGKVYVTCSGQKSNEVDFSVLPSISGIFPTSGLVGDQITISGASFGSVRGTNYVSFNGTNVTQYVSWSEASIVVKVPSGTSSGKVIAMIGSIQTNQVDFTMIPHITSITPDNSYLGEQVTITGENFGSIQGSSKVTFKTADVVSYVSWSNTSITVTVPSLALSGKVSVTVLGIKSNELDFTCNSIMIGNQEWMVKNIDVTTYRNGDAIPECTDNTQWNNLTTGAWCYYNNNSSNGPVYGKMYNWYAVTDSRGFGPTGWHVPSDGEFTTLGTYLGGDLVAGGKMKETGNAHWNSPNTGATNESGFTGLGGGYRWSGGFQRMGDAGVYWTTTQSDASNAYPRTLFYNSAGVTKPANPKTMGMSVRMIKN